MLRVSVWAVRKWGRVLGSLSDGEAAEAVRRLLGRVEGPFEVNGVLEFAAAAALWEGPVRHHLDGVTGYMSIVTYISLQ